MPSTGFTFKQFHIEQGSCAMKVGTDSVLLGAWSALPETGRILDIGCGTGILSLMAAQRTGCIITAVEIEADAASQARININASKWSNRIDVVCADIRTFSAAEPFQTIVCNPPYFQNSLAAPLAARAGARQGVNLSFDELLQAAARLLSQDGEMFVVLPCDALQLFLKSAAMNGLHQHNLCYVSTAPGKQPKRVLLSLQRHCTPSAPTTLVMGSPAQLALTSAFYLTGR